MFSIIILTTSQRSLEKHYRHISYVYWEPCRPVSICIYRVYDVTPESVVSDNGTGPATDRAFNEQMIVCIFFFSGTLHPLLTLLNRTAGFFSLPAALPLETSVPL